MSNDFGVLIGSRGKWNGEGVEIGSLGKFQTFFILDLTSLPQYATIEMFNNLKGVIEKLTEIIATIEPTNYLKLTMIQTTTFNATIEELNIFKVKIEKINDIRSDINVS